MADPCCATVVVPLCSTVLNATLPCLCNKFDKVIGNTHNVDNGRPDPIEQILPGDFIGDHRQEEFNTLAGLHRQKNHAFIGIIGLGGMGKTVLLQRFHNELMMNRWFRSFDIIIFVEDFGTSFSSVNDWIHEVQKTIASRLCITPLDDQTNKARARQITQALQSLSFAVIIDNVIEGATWQDLGIPTPNNSMNSRTCTQQRKIVFSARHRNLPGWPTSDESVIQLCLLDSGASWKLFNSMLLKKKNQDRRPNYQSTGFFADQDVENNARELVGLLGSPRLIFDLVKIIQDNQNYRHDPKLWQDFLIPCESSSSEIQSQDFWKNGLNNLLSGMVTKCFDRTILKPCLLFFSLFPEKHSLDKGSLIDYWMCEGLFTNAEEKLSDIRSRILVDIIQNMMDCYLIQPADEDKEEQVKITDRHHATALVIAKQEDEYKTVVLINGQERKILALLKDLNTESVQRVSLINSKITKLECTPLDCPCLKTLIVSGSKELCSISDGFFSPMPNLRILDLSHTAITEITVGIRALCSLRYLNLSFTGITELPTEITELARLEHLNLEGTCMLEEIPQQVFSHLSNTLHLLKINNSYTNWIYRVKADQTGKAICIFRLERFIRLKHLAITIKSVTLQEVLLVSEKLGSFTKHLEVKLYKETSLNITSVLAQAPTLEELYVTSSDDLRELTVQEDSLCTTTSLKVLFLSELKHVQINWQALPRSAGELKRLLSVTITKCNDLQEVTWISHIPNLKYLTITECQELKKLITTPLEGSIYTLAILKKMTLDSLPNLVLICNEEDVLNLRSLVSLSVRSCFQLTKLPLPKECPEKLVLIKGEQSWWDKLVWGKKHGMLAKYTPIFKAI